MGDLETIELLEQVMHTLTQPGTVEPALQRDSLSELRDLFPSGSESEYSEDAVLELLEGTEDTPLPIRKPASEDVERIEVDEGCKWEDEYQSTPQLFLSESKPEETEALEGIMGDVTVPHPSEVSETFLAYLSPTDSTAPVILREAEKPPTREQLEAIEARREYYRTAEQDTRL